MSKKVYVLWASQGKWSDHSEWIVNIYSTLEGALTDPQNAHCNLSLTLSLYDGTKYYTGVYEPEEYEDPIEYSIREFEVLDYPAVEVDNAKNHN